MQTSRRSILKGGILASLAGTMGATAMSASAAEKPLRQEGAGHDRVRADGAWRRDAANGRAPVPHAGRWEHHPLHRG